MFTRYVPYMPLRMFSFAKSVRSSKNPGMFPLLFFLPHPDVSACLTREAILLVLAQEGIPLIFAPT